MEAKLRFQVKNLLESGTVGRSTEEVVAGLRKYYPEHGRRPVQALMTAVAKVLGALPEPAAGAGPAAGALAAGTPTGANGGGAVSKGKKRGREGEAEQERRHEDAARADDAARRASPAPSLNQELYASQTAERRSKTPSSGGTGPRGPRSRGPGRRRPGRPAEDPSAADDGAAFPQDAADVAPADRPRARYDDLGGLDTALRQVRDCIVYPLCHPEVYAHLGVDPPRGVLLHGPPGCGKTLLAHAVAGELGCAFFSLSAPEVVSGMSGESEQKIRGIFAAAAKNAPSLVFLDEVDAITPKRETAARAMERRIVAQLITCMDGLGGSSVVVIGATNRPDALDQALRRAGRFDREICLGVPDDKGREAILRVLTRRMRLHGDMDLQYIAKKTPGFVGADLTALSREAAAVAVARAFRAVEAGPAAGDAAEADIGRLSLTKEGQQGGEAPAGAGAAAPFGEEQLQALYVTMDDFREALPRVQPSAKREGFATQPDVSWEDVGALGGVREELALSVVEPIEHPERFERLGLSVPAGVLLWGPPGCGKTLLAKAVAAGSSANFISVKGPELLDKYVGESERAVRQVFQRARESSPCIIFFDELDAICPRRGAGGDGGSGVSERVVNQLLTEMDGADKRNAVFVIAATNRPDMIDPAMLRPGRLDKLLYVPVPGPEERGSILKAICHRKAVDGAVDLSALGRDPRLEGFSGADLSSLVREAGMAVLREAAAAEGDGGEQDEGTCIEMRHFEKALEKVGPSVVGDQASHFMALKERMLKLRRPAGKGRAAGSGGGKAKGKA